MTTRLLRRGERRKVPPLPLTGAPELRLSPRESERERVSLTTTAGSRERKEAVGRREQREQYLLTVWFQTLFIQNNKIKRRRASLFGHASLLVTQSSERMLRPTDGAVVSIRNSVG